MCICGGSLRKARGSHVYNEIVWIVWKETEVLSSHNFYPVTSHENPLRRRNSLYWHELTILLPFSFPLRGLDLRVCETEQRGYDLTKLPQEGTSFQELRLRKRRKISRAGILLQHVYISFRIFAELIIIVRFKHENCFSNTRIQAQSVKPDP
jgi:hypothetical protein